MRRVGEGRGHPVPGPRPRVAGVACLGKRAVEEGRAGAVEASLVITGLCLGVSGGQAVVVGGVAELGGRGEADQGPGPAHRHAALVTERTIDGASVIGGVVTRKGAATSIQSKIVKNMSTVCELCVYELCKLCIDIHLEST